MTGWLVVLVIICTALAFVMASPAIIVLAGVVYGILKNL